MPQWISGRITRTILSFAIGCVILPACSAEKGGGESEAQPDGAVGITVLDSVRLQETDSTFVARLAGIAVTTRGDLFIGDNGNKKVFHFARDGRFLGTIARRGSGPGEVESVSSLALDGDSLIVVKNLARMRVEVFSALTGDFRWGRNLPQRTYDVTANGGTIYASAPVPNSATSVVAFKGEKDPVTQLGWVPKILRDHPILMGPFGTVSHDVAGLALVEVFEVSDYVYVSTDSLSRDSIILPQIRRRGAATEELSAAAADTSKGREALFKSSIPMLARFINDSIVAVVHSDVEMNNNLFTGKYFLSLVNFRGRKVCIDLPLPLPADPLPRITMVGDTLIAAVQHVSDSEGSGTYVVRMHVNSTTCPWNFVAR